MTPASVEVSAPAGIVRATLENPEGVVLVPQRPAAPVEVVELRWPLREPGTYRVRVDTADGARHVLPLPIAAPPLPMVVTVDAPVGQGQRSVSDGDVLTFTVIEGRSVQAALVLTALTPGEAEIQINGRSAAHRPHLRSGERLATLVSIAEAAAASLRLNETAVDVTLQPRPISLETARAGLAVTDVVFPAGQDGVSDRTRPSGRVALPASWWRAALRWVGLGFRPRSGDAPWAWQGVVIENRGEEDVNVAVSARVLDQDGAPARAFAPRMRAGSDGTGRVAALLRVPAEGAARAALPLYVDERLLGADAAAGRWTREISVTPIGAEQPLLLERAPLYVSRGSTAASAGLLVALLAAIGGSALILVRAPRWLRETPTSELMTVALFGALSFFASAAGRVLSMGAATLLGPFAILFTGLIDDVLRYALWATLLTLMPRPGVGGLTVLTHWLLTGIALGDFSPTDILFVGGRVLWLEGALWIFGITRPTGWRDQGRVARWGRLSLAFGLASVATSATGLVLHVALYRLFLADWYVAMVLIGPGFCYVALACWVAAPFADSLRRIQR